MHYPSSNPHLFENFRSGSRRDFDLYYREYCRRIFYYLQERTGDFNAAQDTTQRVFVTLFTNRAKVKNERHILPFLYIIAQNFANEYLRENGRLEDLKAEMAYIADGHTDGADVSSAERTRGEILNLLHEALQALPPRKREIIHLHYWLKMPVIDIAGRLGIAPQTVRNQISQSLVLLRKSLTGEWEHIILYFS